MNKKHDDGWLFGYVHDLNDRTLIDYRKPNPLE